MAGIFISYRRDDSAYIASAINDRFQNRFGGENIFFDIDTIPLGVDFRDHIGGAVGGCDVLLVVIGDQWVNAKDKDGELRLPQSTDYVRVEIESALQRNVPVVPVLVGNATMPTEADLPESIRELAFRNAAEVRAGRDLSDHLDRLVRDVGVVAGIKPTASANTANSRVSGGPGASGASGALPVSEASPSELKTGTPAGTQTKSRAPMLLAGALLLAVIGVGIAFALGVFDSGADSNDVAKDKAASNLPAKDADAKANTKTDATVDQINKLIDTAGDVTKVISQINGSSSGKGSETKTGETKDGDAKSGETKDSVTKTGENKAGSSDTKDGVTKVGPLTQPVGLDRTDAKATAAAILTAYKARDFKALAPLVSPVNVRIFSELAVQGTKHPRYESILSGWRGVAVQTWTGAVEAPRYDKVASKNGIKAIVRFEQKSLTPLVVVAMTFREGQWEFEDIESPPEVIYNRMSTERPR